MPEPRSDSSGKAESILDPVALQICWSRLVSIMEEVDIALVRASFSTIVGETRDFAVVLLDGNARSIAQSQLSSPAFTCSLPFATRAMLEVHPPADLVQGDVLITNDPWLCHGHLTDLIIVVPLFCRSRLTAYIATAAHVSDIGGRLDEFDARDVFEEGLRIPPSKLQEGGQQNRQLYRIMAANIRAPEMVLGDVEAIVGAARVGGARLSEFIADYSEAGFRQLADAILVRSEAAMREAIRGLPDGAYVHEIEADGHGGKPTLLRARVEVRADTIHVDYAGSSPQRSDAGVNCVLNTTHAHTIFPLKCSLLPGLPNNEGLFRPISSSAPVGSIVNCRFPAPVKARSKTSYHLHNAIYGALAEVLPRGVQAGSGSFWSIRCHRLDDPTAVAHVLPNGGKGAVQGRDGLPTIAFPGNGTITPAEILENRVPLLLRERSLRRDSGGAGRNRGGLGQVLRLACHGVDEVRLSVRTDKTLIPAPGIAGGSAGAAGEATLDGNPMPLGPFLLRAGSELELRLPGGGGVGRPDARDPEALARDIALGYVSPEAAGTTYGATPERPRDREA